MTTDDLATEQVDASSGHQVTQQEEQEGDKIEHEETEGQVKLPEQHKRVESPPQVPLEHPKEDPNKIQLMYRFAGPDTDTFANKDEIENMQSTSVQNVACTREAKGNEGDGMDTETGAAPVQGTLRSDEGRIIFPAVATHSGALFISADTKEAVQDPNAMDIAPSPGSHGVIDVDTFEDEESADEGPDPSPAIDETTEGSEEAEEPSNNETHNAEVDTVPSEAIDLTISNSSPVRQSTDIPENDENIHVGDDAIEERHEAITTGSVIDVDEQPRQAEVTMVETPERTLTAEGRTSSPTEDDDRHQKVNTDSETVSADVDTSFIGEDISREVAPIEPIMLEAVENSGVEQVSTVTKADNDDKDEEEDQGPEESEFNPQIVRVESGQDEGAKAKDTSDKTSGPCILKPENADGQWSASRDEAEDDDMDDDEISGQHQEEHRDSEVEEGDSSKEVRETSASDKAVHEESILADRNETVMERALDSNVRSPRDYSQDAFDAPDANSNLQVKEEHETSERTIDEDPTPASTLKDEDKPVTDVHGTGRLIENKDLIRSASSVKDLTVKSTAVVRDAGSGSWIPHIKVTPEPVSGYLREAAKDTHASPSSADAKAANDSDNDTDVNSNVDPDIDSADHKKSSGFTVPSEEKHHLEATGRREMKPGAAEQEGGQSTADAQVNHSGMDASRKPINENSESNAKDPIEKEHSKVTGTVTGHLAPMFGIQLSRPVKTGPISFSSPPSFPRYALNPLAVPFMPAKRRRSGSPEKNSDRTPITPTVAIRTPSRETTGFHTGEPKVADAIDSEINSTEEKVTARGNKESLPVVSTDAGLLVPTANDNNSNQAEASPDRSSEPAALESEANRANSTSVLRLSSEVEPTIKRPARKKVSFAPTPIKSSGLSSESGRDQFTKSDTAGPKASGTAEIDGGNSAGEIRAALVDGKAAEGAPLDVVAIETESIKEKQRIVQVQTDEGLRREVSNVTVAMRQGNGKVRPERKKFTIRLTTGAEDKAKLQLFKANGPSLKLYASLDSSRDNLRVRKVTNRKYVMSVAKVAPASDNTTDILVKYFLHFDEHDTFEEIYSQCVANLQKQQRPSLQPKRLDDHQDTVKVPIEEKDEDSNPQFSNSGGVKRPADSSDAAQVSKKSKLLADKKKLLDKMAALRRKKGQKGISATQEKQTEPSAGATSVIISLPHFASKATGNAASRQSRDADENPRIAQASVKSRKVSKEIRESAQPLKKRTGENMSNEKDSKRLRVPSSHSVSDAMSKTPASAQRNEFEVPEATPGSLPSVAKDRSQEDKVAAGTSPSQTEEITSENLEVSTKHAKVGSSESEDVLDPHTSKEAKALMDIRTELKKSKDENTSLQSKIESQSRMLTAEREKAMGLQQESSNALERVMKAVESLSADIRHLTREKTDRSLLSLTRCETSSSEDFFDRLHSFRPSTWAAFDDCEIGALECALRGWHNCGPGKIRSSEGCEIVLSKRFDDKDFRRIEVERVRSLLREGHCLLSGWIGQSCPELFRTFQGSQRMLTKEQLKANVDNLRREGIEASYTGFEWGTSALLLSDDVCEKLAAYNWCIEGQCLRCAWCNRRVSLDGEAGFNAKLKHYSFCPFRADDWKTSVLRNAKTLGIEGEDDAIMADATTVS